MAFKRQKKGVDGAAAISVLNSFNDFESELRIAAKFFGGDCNILPTFTINTKY